MRPCWPLAAASLMLCACQPGAAEGILITSDPPGAACSMERAGARLGAVAATPGRIEFAPGPGTLDVACTKAGFAAAHADATPSHSSAGFVPLNTGLIGLAILAAAPSGPKSDWHYPAEIRVELRPIGDPGTPLPLSGLRLR